MKAVSNQNRVVSVIAAVMMGALVCFGFSACKAKTEQKQPADTEKKKEAPAPKLSFEEQIKKNLKELKWRGRKKFLGGKAANSISDIYKYANLRMSRDIYKKSFDMGTDFLLKYQNPEGNFKYQYDWIAKTWKKGDNQVRQTGALWGLSLCHHYEPQKKTQAGLIKGFDYWFEQTIPGPDGTLTVRYKNNEASNSGTVALLSLAIIEFLRTEPDVPADYKAKLEKHLKGYLGFLKWMQLDSGHFAKSYMLSDREKSKNSSPYFDGETMLCLCKAARYLGHTDLIPTIEKAARATAETYTVKAWEKDPDSAQTKGFYQWGSMSFVEYYEAKWANHELYADVTLLLSWWMIHTHKTLDRSLNTSYALEGLISAFRIARYRKDINALTDLFYVIDRMFNKLTKWQINGPLAHKNKFLVENPTDDEWAVGGIMNKRKPARRPKPTTTYHELRVDVTQHQMHAVTLALRYVYPEADLALNEAAKAKSEADAGAGAAPSVGEKVKKDKKEVKKATKPAAAEKKAEAAKPSP